MGRLIIGFVLGPWLFCHLSFAQEAGELGSADSKSAQSSPTETTKNSRVSPTVELALVLAALSPLGTDDDDYSPVAREGDYYLAAMKHFENFRHHAAVKNLGRDFNMPRLVGNAADFSLNAEGKLLETTSDGSLWDDREGDLFRKHLPDIQAFASASDFMAFYTTHRPFYRSLESASDAINDLESMTTWLEGGFKARPNRAQIFVSALLDGHHWTSGQYQPTLRIWVNAPNPDIVRDLDQVNRVYRARSVFTELDHPYVNPVSATKVAAINAALGSRSFWGTAAAWDNYSTAEAVFNEYMTFAVYLMYARDELEPKAFAAVKELTVKQMADRRGFTNFAAFASQLLSLSDNSTNQYDGDAEALFDPMIDWCQKQHRD